MAVQVRAAFPSIIIPGRYGIQRPQWPFTINRDSPQAEGLVAWWPVIPFGDDGPLRELVRGFDATRNGNPTFQSDPEFLWYQALDGTGDFWDVGDEDELDAGTVNFCFSCWLRNPDNVSFTMNKRLDSNAVGWEFLHERGNVEDRITVRLFDGDAPSSVNVDWDMPTADGQWHLACGVVDRTAGLGRIYGDGIQISTQDISGWLTLSNAQSLQLGARNGANLYAGDICDVRVYKNVLIGPQVAYQMWDPHTRHDLIYELRRVFYSFPAAAAVGNPWHVYAQQ